MSQRAGFRLRCGVAVAVSLLVAGCTQPPAAAPTAVTPTAITPPGAQAPKAQTPRVPAKPEQATVPITSISATEPGSYWIKAPRRSLGALKKVEKDLLAGGWKPAKPKSEDEPGHRKWLSTGFKVGPTDAYDAAWRDPKNSKLAVLTLSHLAESPGAQHVTLEFLTP